MTANTSLLPDPSNPLIAVEAFTKFVINAAEISIPQSSGHHKPNRVPWWSQEISLALKARKRAHRTYKSTHSQIDFIEYKKARAKTRVLVRDGLGAHLLPA